MVVSFLSYMVSINILSINPSKDAVSGARTFVVVFHQHMLFLWFFHILFLLSVQLTVVHACFLLLLNCLDWDCKVPTCLSLSCDVSIANWPCFFNTGFTWYLCNYYVHSILEHASHVCDRYLDFRLGFRFLRVAYFYFTAQCKPYSVQIVDHVKQANYLTGFTYRKL